MCCTLLLHVLYIIERRLVHFTRPGASQVNTPGGRLKLDTQKLCLRVSFVRYDIICKSSET